VTVLDTNFDRITAGTIENIVTANGNNDITLNANADAAGIVSVVGGTGNDTFEQTGTFNNDATFVGGNGNDVFQFSAVSQLEASSLDGGNNTDTIEFTTDSVTVLDTNFDRITAGTIENIVTANGNNDITLNANADAAGIVSVVGGTGNDTFEQTGTFNNDATLVGGNGNDVFQFSAVSQLEASSLDGGNNTDTIEFTTDSVTVADANFDRITAGTIENIVTANGNNDITLGANADAAGISTIVGGTGIDDIEASAYASGLTFIATLGGSDIFLGGLGNDDVLFASNSDLASSNIDGGVGTNDTIEFTAENTIVDSDFTDVANIEVVRLFGASTATFNSEAMDAGIATVYGGSGNNDITQGVGFTSNFDFIGQGGDDSVTIQNAAQLANNDINGDTGTDTLTLGTAGTYANTDFVNISDMDVLVLANGTNDVTIGGSGIMTVYGGTGNDDIDATGYTSVTLQGWTGTASANAGIDTLTGGNAADLFVLGDTDSNAYGLSSVLANNKVVQINSFDIANGDVIQLWDYNAPGTYSTSNNGVNAMTISKGGVHLYTVNYTNGVNTGSIYTSGNVQVAAFSYLGDGATFGNNDFSLL
jgi:hypothetical protein